MIRAHVLLLTCLASGFLLPPASAVAQTMRAEDVVELRELPGWRMDNGNHMAGLEITLAPGWKTYWRVPGEAGIPPRIFLTASGKVTGAAIHWPTPDIFTDHGIRTVGYTGRVVLPLELSLRRNQSDIPLRGEIEIGVCREICLPVTLSIATELPMAGGKSDGAIRAALRNRPVEAARAGLSSVICRIRPTADGLSVTATLAMPPLGRDEVVVFELPDKSIWVAEATAERSGGILVAQTEFTAVDGKPFPVARSDIHITVLADGRGAQIQGCDGG
ncbi:MAG: protein-disulfide reductase DsbD domain-containing protein [Pseudomonadota bacterium]